MCNIAVPFGHGLCAACVGPSIKFFCCGMFNMSWIHQKISIDRGEGPLWYSFGMKSPFRFTENDEFILKISRTGSWKEDGEKVRCVGSLVFLEGACYLW